MGIGLNFFFLRLMLTLKSGAIMKSAIIRIDQTSIFDQ